jgi:hypothetical protein
MGRMKGARAGMLEEAGDGNDERGECCNVGKGREQKGQDGHRRRGAGAVERRGGCWERQRMGKDKRWRSSQEVGKGQQNRRRQEDQKR